MFFTVSNHKSVLTLYIVFHLFYLCNCALPDRGKYDFQIRNNNEQIPIEKSLYKGSQFYVSITCDSLLNEETNITIIWNLLRSYCWDFEENRRRGEEPISLLMNENPEYYFNETFMSVKSVSEKKCSGHIMLAHVPQTPLDKVVVKSNNKKRINEPKVKPGDYIYEVDNDGIYLFILEVRNEKDRGFNASVHVEIIGKHGYLSAVDWPLLPFYGCMCIVYVVFGVVWLAVSFLEWRNLLRIQFWIGAVILLGMLEKATFYAEYQSVNATGVNVEGAMLLAEWVSCGKRTLARMLVVIVSLGFGIVKPRLGPMLHRVVGAGALYCALACIEAYLRVAHKQNDRSRQILIAGIPLAILDSAICWWIFTSLVQTTRTLRLRRNTVKLTLYRHFTNALAFSVVASVVFMVYSIRAHKLAACLRDWRQLWLDEAYWHILFSVILLVIMVLWRPTNNNQRYAFTPLLDNPEDADEDSAEEDHFISDAYGVKVRFHNNSNSNSNSNKHKHQSNDAKSTANTAINTSTTTSIDEDIRWVEENIPTAMGDPALPILDSDEEIMNTKFEVSKMQ